MMQSSQPISPDVERANTRYLYMDVFWMGAAFAMEWYFMQVFAIRLGATPAHLGALTSLRALLLAVGAALASRWQSRYNNLIKALRTPTLVYRVMMYLGIAASASFSAGQVDILVAMVVLAAIPTGIAQGCFLGMLPTALSERRLAPVVARRMVLVNATVLVCVVGFGQLLEALPFPINYQIAFVLAFVASFLSWLNAQRVKVPDMPHAVPGNVPSPAVNVWKNQEFVRLMVVIVAICIGVFMASPLIQLHLVRGLDASDAWISVFGLFEMGAGALITLRLDWLINRFGTGRLMVAATFATFLQTIILASITNLPPFIVGSIAFGVGWFSLGVLMYNRLIEIAPQDDFPRYAIAYQMLINIALFVGPLISTFLIQHAVTVPAALLLVAAVRFGAGVLTWMFSWRAPVVRPAEPSEAVA
jgi:predicted MFS family arabinose efflux permease